MAENRWTHARLMPWRCRLRGNRAELRALAGFDPALHELVGEEAGLWLALDDAADALDVGAVFAGLFQYPEEEREPGGDPRAWLLRLDVASQVVPTVIGGVRVMSEDETVIPVPCCTDTDTWAQWRTPIVADGSWSPRACHNPSLQFTVRDRVVEVELDFDGDAPKETLRLDRESLAAAIVAADSRVRAFAASAQRWIEDRCTPEESVRVTQWIHRALGLDG